MDCSPPPPTHTLSLPRTSPYPPQKKEIPTWERRVCVRRSGGAGETTEGGRVLFSPTKQVSPHYFLPFFPLPIAHTHRHTHRPSPQSLCSYQLNINKSKKKRTRRCYVSSNNSNKNAPFILPSPPPHTRLSLIPFLRFEDSLPCFFAHTLSTGVCEHATTTTIRAKKKTQNNLVRPLPVSVSVSICALRAHAPSSPRFL